MRRIVPRGLGLPCLRFPVLAALAALAAFAFFPASAATLESTRTDDGRIRLRWEATAGDAQLEATDALGLPFQPLAGAPTREGDRWVVDLPASSITRFFRLRLDTGTVLTVAETSPANGETGVAVTRETVFRLSAPLSPGTLLTTNHLYALAGGRRILSRAELNSDRLAATLFYLEPLPASTLVTALFDGTGLFDAANRPVDLDGDGIVGGTARVLFHTLTTTPLDTTGIEGRVFASEKRPDGSNLPLAGVTITVDGREETLRTTTDEQGFFRLLPAPAGRFFVHVDGRTATGSQWPGGAYYPVVGKAWDTVPGRTNNLANGTGEIFLPRVDAETLQVVSPTAETRVTFPAAVVAANPALADVQLTVPPDALFSDDGTRGGRVGMAPVSPDRLPEPLPPGLNLPLVITIQTDGPLNFDRPVPVRFPNLPDPVTGEKLPPGAKSALWSFNHDVGRWEIQGPATVTADGNFVVSDPGVGIRQPGWHGTAPGSGGGGPRGGPPPGPDCRGPNCKELKDCSKDVIKVIQGVIELGSDLASLPEDLGRPFNPRKCAADFAKDLVKSGVECWAYEDLDADECTQGFLEDGFGAGLGCIPYVGAGVKALWDTYLWIEDLKDLSKCQGGGAAPTLQSRTALPHAAPADSGPLAQALRELESQLDLGTITSNYLATLFGSPLWTGPDSPADAEAYGRLWTELFSATAATSPGGQTITPAERAVLLALPHPNGATAPDVEALLARVEGIGARLTTPAFSAALQAAGAPQLAALEDRLARGWATPVDGLKRALLAFTAWQESALNRVADDAASIAAGGGGGDGGGNPGGGGAGGGAVLPPASQVPPPAPRWSVLLVNLETGFRLRTELNANGAFENIILTPGAFHQVTYVDATRNVGGSAWFVSAPAGRETLIPSALAGPLEGGDLDGDGLADLAEDVLGTRPDLADSDGDGLPDGAEWAQRSNPLDGQPLGLGVVATRDLPGTATAVATEGDLAFLALGTEGLAVVDVSNPLDPVLLSQTRWTGVTVGAVAAAGGTVAVANTNGVRLLRFPDGRTPFELGRFGLNLGAANLSPSTLAAAGRWIFAPGGPNSAPNLTWIDVSALRIEGQVSLDPAAGPAIQLRTAGNRVWSLQFEGGVGTLRAHRLENGTLLPEGTLALPGLSTAPLETGPELAVGGTRAYVGGFEEILIIDIADPAQPRLLFEPTARQPGVHDLAATGAGRLLSVSSFSGAGTLALSLFDVRDDRATNLLASWNTPGQTRAVVPHRGYALAADGPDGLAVVNFQETERGSTPPAISLAALVSHPPDGQEADQLFQLTTSTTDNVLVRDVEFYLDDTLVLRSGRFPFEATVRAPALSPGRSNLVARARATDTAGNATWSAPVTLRLLPDSTPPRLFGVTPAPGSTVPRGSVAFLSADFDSQLNPASLAAGWSLVDAGPDDTFDTADDRAVTGGVTRQDPASRLGTLAFPAPLPSGLYRASIDPAITDLGGNALGTGRTWQFRIPNAEATGSTPGNGEVSLLGTTTEVTVRFNEVLDPASASADTIHLVSAGPNGTHGNADDLLLTPAAVNASGNAATLRLDPALPAGSYLVRLRPGLRDVYGGAVRTNLTATFAVRGPVLWAVDRSGLWDTATNWSTRARPATRDHVILDRPSGIYTVTQNVAATVTTLRSAEPFVLLGTSLTAVERATFEAPVSMVGGSRFTGPWTEFLAGVTLSSGSGNRFFDGRARNAGVFHWQVGGVILWFNTTFHNLPTGTILIDKADGNGFVGSTDNVTSALLNEGLLRKVGTAYPAFFSGIGLENRGRIQVAEGSLSLQTLTTNHGSIDAAAGTALVLGGGLDFHPFLQSPSGRVTGDGTIVVRTRLTIDGAWDVPGTTAFSNEIASTFNVPLRTGRLTGAVKLTLLEGGQVGPAGYSARGELGGNGLLHIEGPVITASTKLVGSLRARFASTAEFTSAVTLSADSQLDTLGPVTLRSNAQVSIANRAIWTVAPLGTVELTDTAVVSATTFAGSEQPLWRNLGRIHKPATPGSATIRGVFENPGTIAVDGGRLEADGVQFTHQGALEIAANARVRFADGLQEFAPGSAVRGPGELLLTSRQRIPNLTRNARLRGSLDVGRLVITNTLVELPEGGSLPNLELGPYGYARAGTNLSLPGPLTTRPGARLGPLPGTPAVRITSSGAAEFGGLELLDGTEFIHQGNGRIRNGLSVQFAARLVNAPEGTLTLSEPGGPGAPGIAGSGHFHNLGLLAADTPGLATLDTTVTNSGTVEIRQGALRLAFQLVQTAGSLRLAGGRLELDTDSIRGLPPLALLGGELTGTGSIVFTNDASGARTLTNHFGTLRPGLPLGTLRIEDSYTHTNQAVLELELAGTTPGSGHDQLVVGRRARLGATLRVLLRDGFTPEIGQDFVIITAQTVAADRFATTDLPALPAGRRWVLDYRTDRVLLRCLASP